MNAGDLLGALPAGTLLRSLPRSLLTWTLSSFPSKWASWSYLRRLDDQPRRCRLRDGTWTFNSQHKLTNIPGRALPSN